MKLPAYVNIENAFYTASVAVTAAGVQGSYHYLIKEFAASEFQAGLFAGCLSIGTFCGLKFALNAKAWNWRLAFASIALSCATLSSYTVYQNSASNAVVAASTSTQNTYTQAKLQYDTDLAAYDKSFNSLQSSLDSLQAQNAADTQAINNLMASEKKDATWQASVIRKAITARNEQLNDLTNKQLALAKPVPPTQPATTTISTDQQIPMLARAIWFEVLAGVFVLFATFVRNQKVEQEQAQITTLHAVIARAEKIDNALQTTLNGIKNTVASAKTWESELVTLTEQAALNAANQAQDSLNARWHVIKQALTSYDDKVKQLPNLTQNLINKELEIGVDQARRAMQSQLEATVDQLTDATSTSTAEITHAMQHANLSIEQAAKAQLLTLEQVQLQTTLINQDTQVLLTQLSVQNTQAAQFSQALQSVDSKTSEVQNLVEYLELISQEATHTATNLDNVQADTVAYLDQAEQLKSQWLNLTDIENRITQLSDAANNSYYALNQSIQSSSKQLDIMRAATDQVDSRADQLSHVVHDMGTSLEVAATRKAEIAILLDKSFELALTKNDLNELHLQSLKAISDLQQLLINSDKLLTHANDLLTAPFTPANGALTGVNETANESFTPANATANRTANTADKDELKERVFYQLRNQLLDDSQSGKITPDLLVKLFNIGRPTAQKWLEEAAEIGILDVIKAGRGTSYTYPKSTITEPPSNVITLPKR